MAIGSIGPALGEGKAIAQALSSIAQQPDEAGTISRTSFYRPGDDRIVAIYCFVIAIILIFANPFWNHVIDEHRTEIAMLIEWFTVVAQIVNFLILVALLKHFLYGPAGGGDGRSREANRRRAGRSRSKKSGGRAPV